MSYEGFTQCICEDGHYFIADAHDDSVCPECYTERGWQNEVDQTNGGNQGEIPLDVLREKFLITPEEICTCHCGHKHSLADEVFRVPTKEETVSLRVYSDD